MPLKRKRSSTSAFSPSTSTSTTNTTSRSTSPNPLPDIQMSNTSAPQYPPVDPSSFTQPSHLDSRTRKRFRDNRPDEDTIHGSPPPPGPPLFRSNNAGPPPIDPKQQTHTPPSSPPPPPPPFRSTTPRDPGSAPNNNNNNSNNGAEHYYYTASTAAAPRSLPARLLDHQYPPSSRFFFQQRSGLPRSRWDAHPPTTTPNNHSCCRCEDCDNALSLLLPPTSGTVADAGMMDVDGGDGGSEFACRSCGKRVCDTCAVVQIGVGRDCLGCKTSRREKWVGGIGWCP